MLQVSALVLPSDLQSYTVVLGWEPNFTYRSASPVPPVVTNFRPVAPEGTARVKYWLLPAAPDRPVFATPLLSSLPPVLPTVTEAVLVLVAPSSSVTVRLTEYVPAAA